MNTIEQKGFSLIELLLVVTVIGIIAALAVPAYQKGVWAAENGAAFSAMRTISSTQASFYASNNRFARLTELQPILGDGLGTTVGDTVIRNRYVFEMSPQVPTFDELKTDFTVKATRSVTGDVTYVYKLTQQGNIEQLLP